MTLTVSERARSFPPVAASIIIGIMDVWLVRHDIRSSALPPITFSIITTNPAVLSDLRTTAQISTMPKTCKATSLPSTRSSTTTEPLPLPASHVTSTIPGASVLSRPLMVVSIFFQYRWGISTRSASKGTTTITRQSSITCRADITTPRSDGSSMRIPLPVPVKELPAAICSRIAGITR